MKMKSALLALFCSCLATVGAETIDIYETWKGQAFEGGYFSGFAPGNTYTLSQDFSITNSSGAMKKVRLPNGALTTFDFSDGNHVLKTGVVQLRKENSNPCEVSFIGGIWDVGGNQFGHCGWSNLPGENLTYRFDGVVVTNLATTEQLMLGYGTNQNYLVTGGSRFYGTSGYIIFCPATSNSQSPEKELGRLIEFSGGSKFYAGAGTAVFDNRDQSSTRLQNCIIRFKGEGTVATGSEAGGAGNSDFYLGRRAPGYRLEVVDGARFNFRFFKMGGDYNNGNPLAGSEFGYSNSVYVANGGEISTTYGLTIGQVAGAGHNSVLVDDGGAFLIPTSESLSIGSMSSFNSFTISNGTVTAKALKVGSNAGANSNLLHVAGSRTALTLNSTTRDLFGSGVGNTVLFDDGATFGGSNIDIYFSNNNGSVASTGNTVRVEGGATVTGRNVAILQNAASTNNTLVVADATLSVAELSMDKPTSSGNTLCISNGTVNFTGGYGFHCSGTGNVCRIAGAAPKVRYVGESDGVATFLYGVELQYDLTELSAAYAEPAILVKWFQMHANTHLTFRGVEEVSERLSAPADFVLARATDADHLISSDNAIATVVAEANENLPDRAKLLFANDGHDLVLRVRPLVRGLVITIK